MQKYFKSEIFNNGLSYKYIPVYSILSDKRDFNIDSIPEWLETHKLKNIFVICGGQQTLPFPDEKSSRVYGKNFTGIQLVDYRTYRINRKGSLASLLFDRYKKDSLIIDILDPRFDWGRKPLSTTISVNFIFELLHRILGLVETDPKIILIGFSRGATFALTLAKWLDRATDNRCVFSIDPVIAGWRGEVLDRCVRVKNRWKIISNEFNGFHLLKNSFPVIANPGCDVWNVFQRGSFLASLDYSEYPVGSAVKNSYSLIYPEQTFLNFCLSSPVVRVVRQYNTQGRKHQQMREKYIPTILQKIHSIIHI